MYIYICIYKIYLYIYAYIAYKTIYTYQTPHIQKVVTRLSKPQISANIQR